MLRGDVKPPLAAARLVRMTLLLASEANKPTLTLYKIL